MAEDGRQDAASGTLIFSIDGPVEYFKLTPNLPPMSKGGSGNGNGKGNGGGSGRRGMDREVIASGPLNVISVNSEDGNEVLFFNVGDLNIPLLRSEPCLRVGIGDFIVPLPGHLFMGLHIPCPSPSDSNPEAEIHILTKVNEFAELLRDVTDLKEVSESDVMEMEADDDHGTRRSESPSVSESVAAGISWTGEAIARGVVTGAEVLGSAMRSGTSFITSRTEGRQGEPVHVDERINIVVSGAKKATGTVVAVSSSVVAAVYGLTRVLAREITQSEFARSISAGAPSGAATAASTIGSSVLEAGNSVFEGLEAAARVLLRGTSDSTTAMSSHFLGAEAGRTAGAIGAVVHDVAEGAFNVRKLGTRAILAATAADALGNDDEDEVGGGPIVDSADSRSHPIAAIEKGKDE